MMAPFIQNQRLTTSNKGMISSFEAMWRQKPNLCNLFLFGCKAQVYILDDLCRKLNAKIKDCIFLGYAEGVKARVFEHLALGQQYILQDAIVKSVRLYSKPTKVPSTEAKTIFPRRIQSNQKMTNKD